ncbi:PREDICTED: hemicentin-2 [Dipodomys ordii]|uniref:Hemicentin-2 n=1 Tax=Dipodomys ordii TaxID=10020 RepID=A0A1S3FJG4_DIPOR|nr:PREDICTED: hemicentin-2 [Dipodomys ordii]
MGSWPAPWTRSDIGPVTLTADPAVFQRELRDLYVQGGGDCPEMSVGAIKAAVEVSNPRSFIYVFSDARAKDYHKKDGLLHLLQRKQSQVVFVLTGDCGDRSHPGYLAFEEIASTSSGQVFHLDKQQVTEGPPGCGFPRSPRTAPALHCILGAVHPAGVPISLLINSTGLQASGHLDSVELAHSSGRPLLTLPTQLLSNESTHQLWGGPSFHAPQERFYLKVKGKDHTGSPLVRVSGVSYSGADSGTPLVSMPPRIHGYLRQPLLVSCTVHSALPFRLQLWRDGARLGEERLLPASGNSSWEIPRASKAEEGLYQCTAVSQAGTGRAQTQVVITDPPPQLLPGANVTVSPGETALLACHVLSDDPYNLTWVRDWQVLPVSEGRVSRLADQSLEVRGVVPSDGGQYQCVASNANGASRASTWLLVREAPTVSIDSRSQSFSQGVEVKVSCSASGLPAPHISWSREGLALQEGSRIHVDAQGTLLIRDLTPEDAGNYSCRATNEVGTDEETVTLYYTDPPSASAVHAVVLAAVGEEAVLACAVSGVPPPRVFWYRGALEMILAPEGSSPGTLRIPAAQERDVGIYTCRAVNELGNASAQIQLEVGYPPRLLELPQEVTVELGRSALLACRAAGRPPPTVTWRRADGRALGTGQRRSGVLFFERTAPEHEASYTCEARNIFGKAQAETRLLLTGHVPPQIASSAPVVRVLEGQPVTLPCVILAGRPLPERRWLRAGRPLPPGGRHSVRADGSLRLDGALQDDAGTYSCVATNVAGAQHRDVKLAVQVPPRIHPAATHHVTNEGIPVSLPCVALGVPPPAITWTKDARTLSIGGRYNVSRDGSLVIVRPSPGDTGTYVCTATNTVGFSSQEMRLSVNTKPTIKVNGPHGADTALSVTAWAGEGVTLDCEAQGSPAPLVTWTKDQQPLPLGTDRHRLLPSGSLRLAPAQAEDGGHYECMASNPAGAAALHYVLGVQVPPQVQPGPRVLTVLVGEALDLNCAAEGHPEPQLRWSKDGVAVGGSGTPGSVHFMAVGLSDAGSYVCEASSSAGTDTWELALRVLEPPHWGAEETSVLLERVSGENATLPCPAQGWGGRAPPLMATRTGSVWEEAVQVALVGQGADHTAPPGTPEPQVVWRRGPQAEPLSGRTGAEVLAGGALFLPVVSLADGGDYECQATNEAARGGRQLQLGRAQASDAGLYTCLASNPAGVTEKATRLEVYVPPTIEGAAGGPYAVQAMAGRPVALECVARGRPPPALSWQHEGLPVTPSNSTWLEADGTLRLDLPGEASQGLYSCVASSVAGEAVLQYSLDVQVPPQLLVAEGVGQVTAIAGQSLNLPCRVSGSPMPSVQWLQNGRRAEELAGVQVSPQGTALHIGRVEPSHAGLFACQATNDAGTAGAEVEVTVHEPPSVYIVGGENLTAAFLQPVTLQCVGAGVPPPSLRWWKDGVALATSGGHLQIEKADLRDEGIYTCAASSLAGESKMDVALKVLVPPNIEPGPINKAVLENTSVTLECLASGVPPPDVSWFKGRQPAAARAGLAVSADGRTLHIERAQLADAGSYRCVAANVAGSTELQYGLRVNVPPRITRPPSLPGPVRLGAPVRLTCNATGAPSPTLVWLKDGKPVSATGTPGLQVFPGGRVLALASAQASDSGSYSCVAVSAVGEDRRDVVLLVHMPPSILGEEVNMSVVVNQSVALECQSHAEPPPELSWRKDGRPLEPRPGLRLSEDKTLLEVGRAEPGDAGLYTCEALNQAGHSEKHFHLNVWAPPVFPERETRTLTVSEGHPARLTCDCQGVPFPKISWRKDGQLLPGEGPGLESVLAVGRMLYLDLARPAHEGTYTCECRNAAGTGREDQKLEVHVPPQIADTEEPYTQVSVARDKEAILECNATGRPLPTVAWEKDGHPIKAKPGLWLRNQGQSLHVEHAQEAHAGHYLCVTENVAGRAERRFKLSVLVPPELTGDSDPLANVTAALHSPLTLLCEATGIPPPEVRWFRDGVPISPGEGTYLLAGGWMLRLAEVQEADGGLYSCLARSDAGEARRNFSVEVLVPPSLEEEDVQAEVTVMEGRTAQLTCTATGRPLPKITWFKDGRPLAGGDAHLFSPDGALLEVLQANLSSAGHYSCIAANAVGEKTRHVQLRVLVAPSIRGVTEDSPEEEVTVTVNSPLSLICEALAFPSPSITWMKDGAPFEASSNIHLLPGTHGLQILNVQKEDAGQYTCVVTNELGEAVKNYHVEVLIPPSISKDDPLGQAGVKEVKTKVNSSLALECECAGVPLPAVSWYKDGRPVTPDQRLQVLGEGRLLQIQPTRVSDSGRYLCVATNVAGEDDQDFSVLIQVPPMFQKVSEAGADLEALSQEEEEARGEVTEFREVIENHPAYLYCDTNAVPPPQLTWHREGRPLAAADGVSVLQGGRVLQIPLARAEDAGRYSCKASNEVGEDWMHFELLVLTPPVILGDTEELVEEVTVNASSTVRLQCPALGNPAPTISWLQNGLPVSPSPQLQVLEEGRVLQVSTADVADAGGYMCVAENQAGSAEKLFTLRVQVPPRITGQNPEQVSALVNSSVSLACQVHAHPAPEVTWYRDGQAVPLGEEVFLLPGTHTLRMARVQRADAGRYLCDALNAAGRDQKVVQLSVLAPPSFARAPGSTPAAVLVRAGDEATLSCATDAHPEPTVTWYKAQGPLAPTPRLQTVQRGQTLQILAAQVSDKGVYSCKVSNAAGEATRTFVLTVEVPPTFENPKTEMVSQVAGNPLVLTCDVSGVPPPAVTWLKDRTPVESSVEHGVVSRAGRLQLSRLRPAQAGTYTCVAQNAQAEARKDFVVAVLVAPRIRSSDTARERTVLEEQEVRLDCEADGQPPPHVTWLKDGGPLSQGTGPHLRFYLDGSSLVLKGLRAADSGAYTCVARNAAGEDSRLHTVNVLVPPTIEQGAGDAGPLLSRAGEPVTMACPTRGSGPIHVSWLKDGLPLPLSEHTSVHGAVPPVLEPVEFREDVVVARGSSVTLPCEAWGSPLPLVSWMKDGEPLLTQSLEQGPGLQLDTVGAGDAGSYLCVAASQAGEARRRFQLAVMGGNEVGEARKVYQVTVHAPPTIADDQTEFTVTRMAPVVLTCHSTGVPSPAVSWSKAGTPLGARGGGYRVLPSGALQIEHALPIHTGRYTCTAHNSAGVARKHVALIVQASPVVKPLPSVVEVLEAQGALLPCEAVGAPLPTISWQKEGLNIQAGAGTQVLPSGHLRIAHASPEDAGNYLCVAQNSVGSAVGKTRLRVLVPPVIDSGLPDLSTTEGSHALLPCTARGNPDPDITWEKDGQPVAGAEGRFSIQPSGELLVKNSEGQDAGTYTCTAENAVGRARRRVHLTILALPVFTTLPGDRSLRLGDQLWLRCAARGSPTPRIGWTHNDRPVTEGVSEQDGGSTLKRAAISREDSGAYTCWAENRVGRVQTVSFVHVKEAPVLQGEAFSYLVEPVGGSIRLDCEVRGDPAPDIQWTKDGLPLPSSRLRFGLQNGSLTIRRAELEDAGQYQCLAENEVGSVKKVLTLVLQSTYECVAHNLPGSATALAFLVVRGAPQGSRGSMTGVINGQEFGVATLNTSVQQEGSSGATTIHSSVSHLPANVGPLLRTLVVAISPVYWALAGERGAALNGHSLTGGHFQQDSHVEFATGEQVVLTQAAQGLDPQGFLLLDVAVQGAVPESLAEAELVLQDFEERYVQTGPGQLFVGATQRFLHDGQRAALRCNHSIRYAKARGPQPRLVQHLWASRLSSAFDPEAQALRFQLTAALQAEENDAGCPEGFELDPRGAFCADTDECSGVPSPCSHSCHNAPGRFSCSCPEGFALAWDGRSCRDVDECAWEAHLCLEDQRCVNLLGSYHCLPDCGAGFRVAADGASCEDVDECLEQLDECHSSQLCENTAGSHHCSCPRGYRLQGPGLPCLDINECLQLPRPCAHQCYNLQGGYRCLCPPGQALLWNGKACVPLEQSEQNVTTVSHRGPLVPWLRPRAPAPGGAYHAWLSLRPGEGALSSPGRAWCPPGFIRQNGVCTDLDECRVRSLCQHACRNTEGSYRCLCPSGYRLLPSGKTCQDINECEEERVECGPGQMCFNTRGSFQCVDTPCPATYRQGPSPGTCFRRCSQDCSAQGASTLQYRLLPLPLGVRARHDVARLAAFSELPPRACLCTRFPGPGVQWDTGTAL